MIKSKKITKAKDMGICLFKAVSTVSSACHVVGKEKHLLNENKAVQNVTAQKSYILLEKRFSVGEI